MTKEAEQLNEKAVYLLLENIINNDWEFDGRLIHNDAEIIKTSLGFALMITKTTHDVADHTYISKIADLYDQTDNGEAEDYIKTVYGKQLKTLGTEV